MRAARKLIFGETVALPVGVGLVLGAALVLHALAPSWWCWRPRWRPRTGGGKGGRPAGRQRTTARSGDVAPG